MRILHVGKFFPPHPGGIERFVAELAAAQAARGDAVCVLAHAEPGSWRSRRTRAGSVDVHLAACPGQLLYAPFSPAFPQLLASTLAEFKPDVLHLHVPNTSAFWALMSGKARRLPWIVHWHADIPLDTRRRALRVAYAAYRPWESALLRRARAIIATSQPYLDSSPALQHWRDKVRVIPLGIANSRDANAVASADAPRPCGFSSTAEPAEGRALAPAAPAIASQAAPERTSNGALRILAVGRLSYFKGFDVLIRAIARLPDAQLVIAGDGECRTLLRLLVHELQISDRVEFTGRIDIDAAGQERLARLHSCSDVFCLPSTERAESFGLVLLEAMRAGKPVVASDIPGSGVAYVVRDGETGMLVPPRDVDALVAALQRLSADAGERARMGAAGARRFAQCFTLDAVAPRIAQLQAQLLRDTTSPAT